MDTLAVPCHSPRGGAVVMVWVWLGLAFAQEVPHAPSPELQAYLEQRLGYLHVRDNWFEVKSLVAFGHDSPVYGGGTLESAQLYGRTDRLAVARGEQVLDVPDVLMAIGEPDRARQVQRRIKRRRIVAGVFQGIAAVGLGTMIVSVVNTQVGDQLGGRQRRWLGVAIGSMVTASSAIGIGGLVGSRADRLQYDVIYTVDFLELRKGVRLHNQELAEQLGVDAREAAEIDASSE